MLQFTPQLANYPKKLIFDFWKPSVLKIGFSGILYRILRALWSWCTSLTQMELQAVPDCSKTGDDVTLFFFVKLVVETKLGKRIHMYKFIWQNKTKRISYLFCSFMHAAYVYYIRYTRNIYAEFQLALSSLFFQQSKHLKKYQDRCAFHSLFFCWGEKLFECPCTKRRKCLGFQAKWALDS